MKKLFIPVCIVLALSLSVQSFGQEEEIKKAAEKKVSEGLGKLLGGKKKKKTTQATETKQQTQNQKQEEAAPEPKVNTETKKEDVLNWSKYDFVPGDNVIFEDDLVNEENGEFPSRWDLVSGNVEVAEFGGENVIMFRDGAPSIVPYFKEVKEDYLPDVFTVEFDLYCSSSHFVLYLYDRKNQKSGSPTGYTDLEINHYNMDFGASNSDYPDKKNLAERRWMHVSVAYTNGKLKAYMDETRLINIPRIDFDPKGITLYTYHASDSRLFFVKNIRIAEGGVKYYDRVMQDGKIIVNGIRFDLGKSSLKPESMGAINEIVDLMQKNQELKFSVEGHTDSQGDDAFNLKLSEERAKTVMNTMVKMGIAPDRLSFKGWGETKPISNNASPEDMANNRRVEFVKI